MLKNRKTNCRKLLIVSIAVIVSSALVSFAATETLTISADKALQNLKEGNERFAAGKATHQRSDTARLAETSKNGQHPFVTVLTCSDSRLPAELIFDQGIGDIFVVRVAGNVCHTDEAGTIEYGAGHLGTPLLVVLGHTSCGAVTAVTTEAKVGGNIAALVGSIKPAVEKAAAANPHLGRQELVPEAIKANCWQSIEDLFKASPETCELVKAGKLKVVAAIYNVETGKVGWLGSHPEQNRLIASAAEPSEKKEAAEKSAHADAGSNSEKPSGEASSRKRPAHDAASDSSESHHS